MATTTIPVGGRRGPQQPTEPGRRGKQVRPLDGSRGLVKKTDRGWEPLGDDERVTIVNVSLADAHFDDEDGTREPKDGKYYLHKVHLKPGESHELKVLHARRALASQELKKDVHGREHGLIRLRMVVGDGDCMNEQIFELDGVQFPTCPYLNCKTCGPPGLTLEGQPRKWTVLQSHRLVVRCESEAAINRWTRDFDARLWVSDVGKATVQKRRDDHRRRMGVGGADNRNATF